MTTQEVSPQIECFRCLEVINCRDVVDGGRCPECGHHFDTWDVEDARHEENNCAARQVNEWVIAIAHSFELGGPYTNGVFATAQTIEEAREAGHDHYAAHMSSGFNLSASYIIWALDADGDRIGTVV